MQPCQVEGLEGERSSRQPLSRDDNSWLAERTPARLDAARAHRPLDHGFIQSLKHAIHSNSANNIQYLNDATESLIRASGLQELEVSSQARMII
jgi:hypothetical protein